MRDIHRARLAVLLLAGLSIPGCTFELCLDLAEEAGTTRQPIIGGQPDVQHRAVLALVLTTPDGGGGVCSGTVIAKHDGYGYLLTAAHCAEGTVDYVIDADDWRDCTPEGDPARCRDVYTPLSWELHPEYAPEVSSLNDFAVVTFAGATDATEVIPWAGAVDGVEPGTPATLSGFGRTYAGPDDPERFQSVRHEVATHVAATSERFLRFDATTGKTACFGDSGGPALAEVGGDLVVVGVASTADEMCEIVATYGRVAPIATSFIAPIVAGGGESGGGGSGGSGGGGGGSASGGGCGVGAGVDAPEADAGGAAPDAEESAPSDPCIPAYVSCAAGRTRVEGSGGAVPLALLALLGAIAQRRRRQARDRTLA